MPPICCPISTLSVEVLQLIAAQLDLEDLCNLGRVSSRFHAFVNEADDVWKSLYTQTFGSVPTGASGSAPSWREVFRDRAAADARRRQLQRRARIMTVRSKVHMLERDVHRCRQEINAERQKLNSLVAEKQRIEQARQLGSALQCWQPDIVKNHHEALLAQTPTTSEWRARELDMGIRDYKLSLKGLTHSLQVQSAQLDRQRMRLQALLGT